MNEQKTGGFAFPWCGDLNDCPTINMGMSLRDYFAAKAMQAMVTAEFNMSVQRTYWAEESYRVADAMLAERAK